jgi:hypothetical protein
MIQLRVIQELVVERDEERDDGRTHLLKPHLLLPALTSAASEKKEQELHPLCLLVVAVTVKSFSACVKRLIAVSVDRNWVPL